MKIRSLTAAGALAGATVLGGVSLAGASDDTVVDPAEVTSTDADALSTGEPEAPTLPDQADDAARTALAERFAGAADDAAESDEADDAPVEDSADDADDADDAGERPDNHGATVSAVAHEDHETGREHGEAVSAAARANGEAKRQADHEDDADEVEADELEAEEDDADEADADEVEDAGDPGADGRATAAEARPER